MLKNIKKIFESVLDYILPPRTDFQIVQKLDEEKISGLAKAEDVEDMDWIHPLFRYKDNKVRAIIWELKYKENILPLGHIGKLFYEEIIGLVSDIATFDTDAQFLLIPIPISDERRAERGFNQSEHIARAILENDLARTLLYTPQWFQKTKDTAKQSRTESRQERLSNLDGCFETDPRVDEKYIILIDDVVTTGSTLLEARKTLLKAGARKVFAFTIAH